MSFIEVSELEWASRLKGSMDYEQKFLENFRFTSKQLGRGTFGMIRLGLLPPTAIACERAA